MNIPIVLAPGAKAPTKARRGDAGYDLYALHASTILPGERWVASTGVSLAIPGDYYGRIAGRSGLAAKAGIDVLGGVLDSSFTGPVSVILLNTSNAAVVIQAGDRIAQLIIEACHLATFIPVDYLDTTERGAGGFGSSGR